MRALDGTEIHPVHIAKVVNKRVPATRRELAYSLRFIYMNDGPLLDEPPPKIQLLVELF